MEERRTLAGIAVSRGIAIGRAHLLAPSELEVRQLRVDVEEVEREIERLTQAFAEVRQELDELAAGIGADAPGEVAAFLELHRLILDDETLAQGPRELIRARQINAEWALTIQLEEVCRAFEAIEDDYLRERATDIRQVVERVLRRLAGARPASHFVPKARHAGEKLVLIAHELAPADILHLKDRPDFLLAGLITELGGPTSHTAILARSLGLPALVGVAGVRDAVEEGAEVVIDADAGELVIAPRAEELTGYRRRLRLQAETRTRLKKLKGRIARTTDGIAIDLFANIELPEDARDALDAGADGIGLFRSEFLFMNRDELPSEDEQFEAYARVARAMKGKPVVIRTLDIGADKVLTREARASLGIDAGEPSAESNPALGLRAIRYCLQYPELFQTQLRAILRASAFGHVKILVPMLAHMHEIEQALAFIARAKQDLKERKLKYDARIAVGGMVEVPAAALSLPALTKKLKFLSIGTNDLIQYTLAIDRADASVAHLYDHLHPAVLRLINTTIKSGARARLPVSVCGELAGELAMTPLLLGMGLKQFSMHPAQIPAVKERIMELSVADAKRFAARVMRSWDAEEVRRLIERSSQRPEPAV